MHTDVASAQDVFEQFSLFYTIIKYIWPVIVVLALIPITRYVLKRIKIRAQEKEAERLRKKQQEEIRKKQQSQINRQMQNRKKEINKFYKNNDMMLKQLDNIEEPVDKSKYRDLNMYFDETGKAKK